MEHGAQRGRRVGVLAFCALLAGACAQAVRPQRLAGPDANVPDADVVTAPPDAVMPPGRIDRVDLLVMVDNSGSMTQNQLNILAQLGPLLDRLRTPPCVLRGDTSGTEVGCAVPEAVPRYPAIRDLHVGIVSSDLGAPVLAGAPRVPGCAADTGNGIRGDDGLLDPIARGVSEGAHLPWVYDLESTGAPLTTLPAAHLMDCQASRTDMGAYPPFLGFCSSEAMGDCTGWRDPELFTRQFRCNAALSTGGCGLESQLESAYRALTAQAATGRPNAGFLRDDALLAILLLTDEEDGSVREGASDVYDTRSTQWAPTTDLNRRFYQYPAPGDAQDPTWNPDRYVNPRDLSQGFLGLKPGHPERVVFAAIAGVPLNLPLRPGSTPADERIDWDTLLGPPGVNGPDDWYGRRHSQALRTDTAQGPISMRHNDPDNECGDNELPTTPACYREGEPHACDTYRALPSRRIVEVARRFDESALCNGQPCHNGIVRSICASNFTSAMDAILRRFQARLAGG